MDKEFAIDGNSELERLVDSTAEGDPVVLTRDGKAVAQVVRTAPRYNAAAAHEAAERIRARRRTMMLGGVAMRDLIDDGRR